MYSENQAIQKKRDNMQTSALEWIINHLKALQNNVSNINNWIQGQSIKELNFTVTFKSTLSVNTKLTIDNITANLNTEDFPRGYIQVYDSALTDVVPTTSSSSSLNYIPLGSRTVTNGDTLHSESVLTEPGFTTELFMEILDNPGQYVVCDMIMNKKVPHTFNLSNTHAGADGGNYAMYFSTLQYAYINRYPNYIFISASSGNPNFAVTYNASNVFSSLMAALMGATVGFTIRYRKLM